MPPQVVIAELLLKLFSVDEMRRLVSRLESGYDLLQELPEGPVSPAAMATAIAELLVRVDLTEPAFEVMRSLRERRRAEIDAAEAACRAAVARPQASRTNTGSSGAVRIAHLSDLHFREGSTWDRDPVLKSLNRDVEKVSRALGGFDLLCITGDIAHSGKASEYELAWSWLNGPLREATGLPLERIRLVPGNHDVDRSKIGTLAQLAVEGLLREQDLQSRVARLLQSASDRSSLLAPKEGWMGLARRLQPKLEVPWWSETLELRGHRVHLAGFDSSWACLGGDDRGRLILSHFICNQLLEGADDADLAVAMLHHPWEFFTERDLQLCEELVRRRCGVILHGHMHQQKTRFVSDPDREVLQLAAGACYAGSSWPNAWQALELDPRRAEAKVHFRLWDGFDWIPDRNRYQSANDGVAKVVLRRAR